MPKSDEERAQTRYGDDEVPPNMNLLDFIMGKKAEKAEPASTVASTPDPDKPYHSADEGKFAREVDLAYGKSWENFVNGKVARLSGAKGVPADVFSQSARKREYDTDLAKTMLDPANSTLVDLTKKDAALVNKHIGEHFSRAAIAAGRSAISTLGFDPSKVALDVVSQPTGLAGFQLPSRESSTGPSIGINVASDEAINKGGTPSTIIHESLHRGLKRLQDRNEEARIIMSQLPLAGTKPKLSEELLVRHLMKSKMGDPEQEAPELEERVVRPTQREQAAYLYEGKDGKKNRDLVQRLEEIAANELVKQHPQGPR